MKKFISLAIVLGMISFVMCNLAEAKRGPAPEVVPLIYKGMKFIAPNSPQKMGYIEAWDIETNKKVWEKKVYRVFINPLMEADVQWVFISSLTIEDGKLVVVNERGKKYKVGIPENILKESKPQAFQLIIESAEPTYEYEVGKPIIISGLLRNVSGQSLYIYTLEETLTVSYEVIGPKGEKIDVGGPIIDLWPPKKDDFALIKPDKSLTKTFKLYIAREDLYLLPEVYAISVIYDVWKEGYYDEESGFVDLNAWTGTVKSNPIKIEIKKSSPRQLSPWTNKAPYPYENEDRLLVKNSYNEEWVKSSVGNHPEAVQRAKEVLREWGRNPDKYEFEGRMYDYEIWVHESENFIIVTFYPIGVPRTSCEVRIRMTKEDFIILSILPGS
jgi:hypothetical protein